MNTPTDVAPHSVANVPSLPDLVRRMNDLEKLVALLTKSREAADAYNPIPPYK